MKNNAMRKIFMAVLLAIVASGAALAQSGKAVMHPDGYITAIFLMETNKRILGQQIEASWFSKAEGYTVATVSAANGDGVLSPREGVTGSINVRQRPTTKSKVVASWKIPEDEVPAWYDCLGKEGDWYKVQVGWDENPVVGYVRQDLVTWWVYDVAAR